MQSWVWLHLPHKNPAGVLFFRCCVDAWSLWGPRSLREQAAGEAWPVMHTGVAGSAPTFSPAHPASQSLVWPPRK